MGKKTAKNVYHIEFLSVFAHFMPKKQTFENLAIIYVLKHHTGRNMPNFRPVTFTVLKLMEPK